MKQVRVLFTIKGFLSSFREVVPVNDLNDDKELRRLLNERIDEMGMEGRVREILLVEQL
jgi:ABC-type amino acid transport substrate-binding protein